MFQGCHGETSASDQGSSDPSSDPADVALDQYVTFDVLDKLQPGKVLCLVFILSSMEDVAMEMS